MSDVTTIIGEIKHALNEIGDTHSGGEDDTDKAWTRSVLTEIGKLGKDKGYFVYASVFENGRPRFDAGEWIFDLCWLDYDDADRLRSAPLVLECEWGGRVNINDDFQKLLLARADMRVMIFSGGTNAQVRKTFQHLKTYTEKFAGTSPGDLYLLCGWSVEDRRFHYEQI